MGKKTNTIFRRDFLKGLATLPFLGFFGIGFKKNLQKGSEQQSKTYQEILKINDLKAVEEKLSPPTGNGNKTLRIGLIGHGWRGEQLMVTLGFVQEDFVKNNTQNGQPSNYFQRLLDEEDLNVEISGICDTFELHAERGAIMAMNNYHKENILGTNPKAKIYPTYREMIADKNIDAVIISTPDHSHAQMAIDAAKAGKHVYLEKPMTHSIEEAVDLKKVIKSSGIVFQLGHENRQQMSFKIARELYNNEVLGDVSMVQTYTNRNSPHGAWIRTRKYDHLGSPENINWKEFLCNAPWHEFDPKIYFNWHRYSEFGTGMTGCDFSHTYDCVNQVLNLGIPDSVMAMGGQYYYKNHGDMPDVFNAVFNYPERGLTLTYDGTLKSGIYRQTHILGSEASMNVDRALYIYKDRNSERYKNENITSDTPMYYYEPNSDVDAVTSATAIRYIKGGYGATYIDGKVIDATFLHLKEWIDAIRGQGQPSCDIDAGFDESVTFNMANLSYTLKKPVRWDREKEQVIIA